MNHNASTASGGLPAMSTPGSSRADGGENLDILGEYAAGALRR